MFSPDTLLIAGITIASSMTVVYSTIQINKTNTDNLKASFTEFKVEVKEEIQGVKSEVKAEIQSEKNHAMEMARQRMGTIEKDVNEIFPRLRKVEDDSSKNCFGLVQIQKRCEKFHP